MRIVILGMNWVVRARMTCIDRFPRTSKPFLHNPKSPASLLDSFNRDVVISNPLMKPKIDVDLKTALIEANNLARRAPHLGPLGLATRAIASTNNLGEGIPAANTMQKSENVSNVALSARVRANHDRELPDCEVGVLKILKISEPYFRYHPVVMYNTR